MVTSGISTVYIWTLGRFDSFKTCRKRVLMISLAARSELVIDDERLSLIDAMIVLYATPHGSESVQLLLLAACSSFLVLCN